MANGRIFILNITAVSGSVVTASLSSGNINHPDVSAPEWDAATSKLTFTRKLEHVGPNNAGLWQPFTGYLMSFHCDPKPPSTDCDPMRRIAGTFETLGEDSRPLFPTSSWYATISNPDKL